MCNVPFGQIQEMEHTSRVKFELILRIASRERPRATSIWNKFISFLLVISAYCCWLISRVDGGCFVYSSFLSYLLLFQICASSFKFTIHFVVKPTHLPISIRGAFQLSSTSEWVMVADFFGLVTRVHVG